MRKFTTVETKIKILKSLKNILQKDIPTRFNASESTLSKLKKKKADFIDTIKN
jgi:hypothetical protein